MLHEDSYERFQKPDHPQQDINVLSRLTFYYTFSIFRKGAHRDFDENDLTRPLDEYKSSILGERLASMWSEEIHKAKEHNIQPNLNKLIYKMFANDVIFQGIVLFIMEIPIRLCQPLFLGLLIRYFELENQESTESVTGPTYFMRLVHFTERESPIQLGEAYFFACGVVFCSLANVVIMHPCMLSVLQLGMKIRVACCSLIYRKTLRLTSMGESVVGTVVNLIANDVNRFDIIMMYVHYLWIAPIQLLFSLLLMYRVVGVAAASGVGIIVAFIPLQAWFGNRTSRFRLSTAYRTDERVRQMNEVILGMQVIKMYTWEPAFSKQIQELRRLEVNALKSMCYVRGAIASFVMITATLAIFGTVVFIVYHSDAITAEKIFVVNSFYQILRQTMTIFFPLGIAQIAETNVSLARIKQFMMLPECAVGDRRSLDPQWEPLSSPAADAEEPRIVLDNVTAKVEDEVCLENVSLEINKGELSAVIGQVGAGKSSLLSVIQGELQPFLGSVDVKGVVSYAAQEPWLFAGSVRQNILFGAPFDRERYLAVISACALTRDLQLLPYSDETIIGEKGASLSGGQRARINLARAVYKQADIYLLDDPLSAVDANVGKHLFDKCICEYLAGKIVILVTHQLQFLSDISKVVLMDSGRILAVGSYEFLKSAELDFAVFLRNQLAADVEPELQPKGGSKIDVLMKDLHLQSSLHLNVIDKEGQKYKPKATEEMRTYGAVQCSIFREYFKAGGNCCLILIVFALFVAAQILVSGADYYLAAWIEAEEFQSAGKNDTKPLLNTDVSVGVYSFIIILVIVVVLTRSFVFFIFCMRSSVNLHNRMLDSIIRAPMAFYNENTSGRILNRFSRDLGAVDELLPLAMIDCFQIMLSLIGAIFIVVTVNYYLAVPTVLMCVVFVCIRSYYLKTSRSVKRLEGLSRSPIFAHLNATVQGLATIRSNAAELELTKEFDDLLDDHSSAWFMFISTARAFGYWLDLICAIYIGIIAISFLLIASTGSRIGLAITTAIGLTGMFQWGMKQSAEVENQMTSVERILEYTKIKQEADLESKPDRKPPSDWPSDGLIDFQELVMKYKPNEPPVLKSVTMSIYPREKVGIVGRTGAGKSSLIGALFRLSNFDGTIEIDSIDTKTIGLHDLRRKLSIIPQEPVLFSGSLRYNMDPFNNYDDESIYNALIVVENKAALSAGTDCLQYRVSEGGVNISVGERQMICLARAILRNNRILVLDEATANIDPKTDKFIQTTIRQKFKDCTLLTIAHRLHTIMDSDRVLVMDAGAIVEFDHPYLLLQDPDGFFSKMVDKTGKAMAANLREVAKMNYDQAYGKQSNV